MICFLCMCAPFMLNDLYKHNWQAKKKNRMTGQEWNLKQQEIKCWICVVLGSEWVIFIWHSVLGGPNKLPQFPGSVLQGRWGPLLLTNSPSMTTRHVDGAVLAAHHKIVDISERERHGGDSYSFGLLEHQLHAVLWRGWYMEQHLLQAPCSAFVLTHALPSTTHKNHLTVY